MTQDWQNFPQDDLDAARRFASKFYDQLRPLECPALGGQKVTFNHKGFAHIYYKKQRTPQEVIERLRCLQYLEEIIADPGAEVEYREYKEKEYAKSWGEYVLREISSRYWTLRKRLAPGLVVKVVIRQVDGRTPYFFSIMRE